MKKKFWPFVCFWVFNSIVLYLAALVYPSYFVLGNAKLSVFFAVLVAGFSWTLITWLLGPIVKMLFSLKGRALMFGFYFLANFVGLWLTARMAPITGFGTTRFVWLVWLAIIADIAQYLIWKLGGFKKVMAK